MRQRGAIAGVQVVEVDFADAAADVEQGLTSGGEKNSREENGIGNETIARRTIGECLTKKGFLYNIGDLDKVLGGYSYVSTPNQPGTMIILLWKLTWMRLLTSTPSVCFGLS